MDEQATATQEALKRLVEAQHRARRSTSLGSTVLFAILLAVSCASCSALALSLANAWQLWGN